ncbi:hypothetical protein GP486_003012 [Trichoglossum hirsutum]|uniref:Uncharacterized protein n=1 Tax=Trichoglossum hirsutum TaxID=265104 RepID=A0A9P8LDC9_9PEZI|nr:hypothetical protein GP486_003012 [Trichoglossum hirsutum]
MLNRKKGPLPELPSEIDRERDLYYQPSYSPQNATIDDPESHHKSSPLSPPVHVPQSSYDTTLSAFAQLATLRLNTRRALISLIDRTNQYILAEATQTLSLQSDAVHNDQDELWFGCTTLSRSQGLCEKALEIEDRVCVKSRGLWPLIINDLSRDDTFKDHPFVTSHPSLRFYAAIPISSKAGFNIGTLCVLDDKPRRGLSDVEIAFLGDMAITIMAHLEMAKVKGEHRRSEKMVKGLGLFVEGKSTLREWCLVGNENPWRDQEAPSREKAKTPLGVDSIPLSQQHISAIRSIEGDPHPSDSKQIPRVSAADLRGVVLSENLEHMFSRASNIIRECIEVDGTIFLDASISTFGGYTDNKSYSRPGQSEPKGRSQKSLASDSESSETNAAGTYANQPSDLTSAGGDEGERKKCGVLGFSTEEKSSLEGDEASDSYVPIAEAFLQRLLHKYPHGQVFNFSKGDPVIPGADGSHSAAGDITQAAPKSSREPKQNDKQAETNALLQMLPGARSVVLFPLWNSHRERWFAGSFAWTTRSTRILTRAEDLSYLAAFGNSIMAGVARLDAMVADRAKSDFISSISHELRSPLHGILTSVEFLQDTTIDLFQNSMVDTIERCGRTLLDTIQHVLDFAKINSFAEPKRNEGKDEELPEEGSRWRAMGLTVDVDLSVVIEDVIGAVYVGHEFQGNSSLGVYDEASNLPSEGRQRSVNSDGSVIPDQRLDLLAKKGRLDVIIDIGWRSNWNFNTQSGALRRVLMNLFGNALKYTDTGWVNVSLQSEDIKPMLSQSPQSVITITVSDSGRGISQEYLHSNLFTPFSQENTLNPGTGLGLSIVLQIVRSLGGTIDVQSKQGVGTEVKVSLTLNQAPLPPQPPSLDAKYETSLMGVRKRTSGLNLCLVGFDVYSGISGTRLGFGRAGSLPALSLQASLEGMATQFFGMKVTASQSWESSPSDIDIYAANEDIGLPSTLQSFGGAPIIVLCSNASVYRAYTRRKGQDVQSSGSRLVHFVSKPCGPHKLAKAFAFCLNDTSRFLANSKPQLSPLEAPMRDECFVINAGVSPEGPAGNEKATKRKPVILLVEDNEINLKLLETFAKKGNYEYDTAENGLLALQACENARRLYDIILMGQQEYVPKLYSILTKKQTSRCRS